MRRTHDADAVGQLKRPGSAGAGDHHHGVAHAHREVAAFTGLRRQVLEQRRGDARHLDLVQRARGQRKQRPADAVTLGFPFLADIAKRHHGLGEMERGGVVQAHTFAQVGQSDAVAVARDFLEDGKSAAERLHPDALPVAGVDIGLRRFHQAGQDSWRRRFSGRLQFASRSHGIVSTAYRLNSTRRSSVMSRME